MCLCILIYVYCICTCRNRIDAVYKFQPPSDRQWCTVTQTGRYRGTYITECFKTPTLDCGARVWEAYVIYKIEMNNLWNVGPRQALNVIKNEKKIKGPWEYVSSLYFSVLALTLSLGIGFVVSVKGCAVGLFYKLWLFGFSCSPWMVSNLMGQAFSTKWAGARKMVMMNGHLWLWQMYPSILSRAHQPLFHTWSKSRLWMMWGLLQSQL